MATILTNPHVADASSCWRFSRLLWSPIWHCLGPRITLEAIFPLSLHMVALRPKENWILKDDTYVGLLNLRGRIEYAKERASGSLSQPEVDEFFREYNQLLLREHEIWKQIRDPNPQERPADPRGIAKTGIGNF
jgi:hypothetical protein